VDREKVGKVRAERVGRGANAKPGIGGGVSGAKRGEGRIPLGWTGKGEE